MTHKEFDRLLEIRLSKIKAVLHDKSREYASPGDKLHNFYTAAKIGNTTPLDALNGFVLKHLVSYYDLCATIDDPTTSSADLPSERLIREKLGDIINYFILAEALMLEQTGRV